MGFLGPDAASTAIALKTYWTVAGLAKVPSGISDLEIYTQNTLAYSELMGIMRRQGFGTVAPGQPDFSEYLVFEAALTYYYMNHNHAEHDVWIKRFLVWGRGHGCNASKARFRDKRFTTDSLTGEEGSAVELG